MSWLFCWLFHIHIPPQRASYEIYNIGYAYGLILLRYDCIACFSGLVQWMNALRQRQNGRHFTDDIFKCIFLNEKVWNSIKIPLKFVPGSPINNKPALVQIMAWRRTGDTPLFEPMLAWLIDVYMRRPASPCYRISFKVASLALGRNICHVTGVSCYSSNIQNLDYPCGKLKAYFYGISIAMFVKDNINIFEPTDL